jgi:hypothetical protein
MSLTVNASLKVSIIQKLPIYSQILSCLLVLSLLAFPIAIPNTNANGNTRIVNISIIIDVVVSGEVDRSLAFLQQSEYHKWNIILTQGLVDDGYMNNSTFVDALKQYGELVPGYWDVQSLTQEQRITMANNTIHIWEDKVGYKPVGFFMFQPDTYLANWLYTQGVFYVQGYCLDQYAIDWMSMRGGWQMPYYASDTHILVPKVAGQGIVVFPHLTWDLIDSFEIDHQYDSNEVDAYVVSNNNYTAEKNYVLQLMKNIFADSSPFGYFTAENEIFGWGGQFNDNTPINHTDFYHSIISEAQSLGANLETYNETVHWFRANFPSNPTYDVKFVSPNSGKTAEWYWSPYYRITRYDGDQVVGYVKYRMQGNDPYLTAVAPPLTGSPHDPSKCVDYSLNFTIDDFGHGNYRAPPQGDRVNYTGALEDFPAFESGNNAPEYTAETFVGASLAILCAVSILAYRKHSKNERAAP